MQKTDNYKKHLHSNSIQQRLINRFYKVMFSLLPSLKNGKVLDVGCGEGFTLNRLNQINPSLTLSGLDISTDAIDLGKKLFPHLSLTVGDIYALPYKDNSFDLIFCNEVLEHLIHPEVALKEISRISRGYCLFSVPNEPFFQLANLLRGKNITRLGNDIEHINHWFYLQFLKWIKNSGFSIDAYKTPFPWTVVIARANNQSKRL